MVPMSTSTYLTVLHIMYREGPGHIGGGAARVTKGGEGKGGGNTDFPTLPSSHRIPRITARLPAAWRAGPGTFTTIHIPVFIMVLALALKAELNGVTDLRPHDTADAPFFYTFKVQCTSCRETHPNDVSFNRFEQNEVSGSKGEANFVWRCKNCKREHSASIKAAPTIYERSDPPKTVNILEFDCRGLEFTEFKPEGDFEAKGAETVTNFTGIDLSDGEWFDYDEKSGEEVSITNVQWEIRRA